jgi:hypothetical protein
VLWVGSLFSDHFIRCTVGFSLDTPRAARGTLGTMEWSFEEHRRCEAMRLAVVASHAINDDFAGSNHR